MGAGLQGRWDIDPCEDECFARHANNPLRWAAASVFWQDGYGLRGDVLADDGKVAIGELKNVRTAAPAGAAGGVRLGTKSTEDHSGDLCKYG